VEAQFIEEPITTLLNVPQPAALLVQRVASDSLGSKLGLQGGFLPVPVGNMTIVLGGDIVLEVVGVPIEGPQSGTQAREKLASLKRRDTVSVIVLRGGHRVQLECRL
jgi:serine protease Do